MKIVCAIQARMGSTRLPGKALKEIHGLPILVHIWRRMLACAEVDEVVVAWGGDLPRVTSRYAMRISWCNDEDDLLLRLYNAGRESHADAILRVRADCLFLDPAKLDDLVRFYRDAYPCHRAVSNWPSRMESEGLDAEVWSMELLAELDRTPECPREDFGTWAIQRGLVAQRYTGHPANDGPPHLSIDTQEDVDRAEKMLKLMDVNASAFRRPRHSQPFRYVPWLYEVTLEAYRQVTG